MRCNLPSYVATLAASGGLLYICIYNPMTDPPLSAMRDLLLSAQKETSIFLVVILPPLDALETALQQPSFMRLQTGKCTQFVSTMCDFEDMLMKASTGFIVPQLAFVVPLGDSDPAALDGKTIWTSAGRILGPEHCQYIEP